MALTKKITKAVKDAQKQAEAAVADVRGQLVQVEGRMPDVQVDPTPFYAVVGAANIAIDTVRTAGEQLEVARRQAKGADLRKGAKKEANQLQKDLQKRIAELQDRTTELQKLATTYAERFVTRAQDLPARVLNEGLVIASNAKDQYDAAAARGEKVAKTLLDVVAKDASKLGSQVEASVDAVESAAAPVPAKRTAAHQRAIRKSAAQKAAATRKANEVEATTTRKVAARSSATTDDPQATVARKVAPAKTAAKKTAKKASTTTRKTAKKAASTTKAAAAKSAATTADTAKTAAAKTADTAKTAAENVTGVTTS